jgi:hypothetical protein
VAQTPYDFKGLDRKFTVSDTPRTGEKKGQNSGAKSDNRGASGWIRQCRSIPHIPQISEITSCRIRCEFGNFIVGRECKDHLVDLLEERLNAEMNSQDPAADADQEGLQTLRGQLQGRPADRPRQGANVVRIVGTRP